MLWPNLFITIPLILGYREDSIEFSIHYFKERKVHIVCLITCDSNSLWSTKLAKAAAERSIMVSNLRTANKWWYKNIDKCLLHTYTNIGVLINAECENTEEIFFIASQARWLDFRHFWLILDENKHRIKTNQSDISQLDFENTSKIMKEFKNMNISVDADIVLATKQGPYYFKLWDIFNFGKVQGGDLRIDDIGTWNIRTGLQSNLNECKYYRRYDFGGWKIRLISVITSPLEDFYPEMLTDLRPVPGVSVITRTSTIIMTVVAEIHNIQFAHTVTDRWVSGFERNSSRKVVNSLYFQEQDLTTVLRFSNNLVGKVTLIHPSVTEVETRYYYRIPSTGPGKYQNQFLRPLSDGVWWSLLGICVICAILLMLAASFERRPKSVQYAVFSVIASVCQQFYEDDEIQIPRKSTARKLIVFVTGISCVLIYNYYTSSVVSWLLSGPQASMNTLKELLESPLDILLEDVGYTRSWLYNADYFFNKRYARDEVPIRNMLLNKMKKGKTIWKSVDEGIAMVKAGGYAYHTEKENANRLISKTFTQSEICEVGSIPSMEKTLLFPGIQINSPYKEFFTWSLTRLQEKGIISCIQQRTKSRAIKCEGTIPRALALGGAAPAFILLAVGYSVAIIIMVFERLTFTLKNKKTFISQITYQKKRSNLK